MCLSFIVEGHLWQCISRKMAEQFQQAVREAATLCPRPMQVVTLWRSTGSGSLWVVAYINCWRQDKLSGDLNSQPKRPGDLDLLTLKVVPESRVTWATSVPILVFLGLSVLDLGWMYACPPRWLGCDVAWLKITAPRWVAVPDLAVVHQARYKQVYWGSKMWWRWCLALWFVA